MLEIQPKKLLYKKKRLNTRSHVLPLSYTHSPSTLPGTRLGKGCSISTTTREINNFSPFAWNGANTSSIETAVTCASQFLCPVGSGVVTRSGNPHINKSICARCSSSYLRYPVTLQTQGQWRWPALQGCCSWDSVQHIYSFGTRNLVLWVCVYGISPRIFPFSHLHFSLTLFLSSQVTFFFSFKTFLSYTLSFSHSNYSSYFNLRN